jgi:hypothetical protein
MHGQQNIKKFGYMFRPLPGHHQVNKEQNLLDSISHQDTALNLLQVQPPFVELMPQSEMQV